MKMPEKIKRRLDLCRVESGTCEGCPYFEDEHCISHGNRDALAYIQQLEAKVPQWISVEERLPENEVVVLILYMESRCISLGYWCEDFAEWDGMDDCEISSPDYWMPLPEPPEEEV